MIDDTILHAIHGCLQWEIHPQDEGAIAWNATELLERLKTAPVAYTGLQFPIVHFSGPQTESASAYRTNEGYEARFTWGSVAEPRLEFWQLHKNGFFGLRRDLPEIGGTTRLETVSIYKVLYRIAESLLFATRLYSDNLGEDGAIVWRFTAMGLTNRYLISESNPGSLARGSRCAGGYFGPIGRAMPVHLARATVAQTASEVMVDFCSFFGWELPEDHFVKRIDELMHYFPGLQY